MLVVGAGPAGGELARLLARSGVDVLLVDQLPDLHRAAFSSAAVPLETLDRFGLPAELVASRWSQWQLLGPGDDSRRWSSPTPLGAVLDFGALRHWLAIQGQRWGGRLMLGLRAVASHADGNGWQLTRLRRDDGDWLECRSRWVIDASGQSRALLGPPPEDQPLVSGLGVEWLLAVPAPLWTAWSGRLSFCLGSDWVPQGYGWIFPMTEGVLKVGICRLEDPGSRQPPLAPLLRQLIERLLGAASPQGWTVLDRHGGRIRSTVHRQEPHRRGRVIGLGDVVSTANLLGGEGIRHALCSSRILAPLLVEALQKDQERPLRAYAPQLRRALGGRWSLSGRLARRTWLSLRDGRADRRLQRLLTGLETQPADTLSALLFDYRFERYGLRALPYLLGWR